MKIQFFLSLYYIMNALTLDIKSLHNIHSNKLLAIQDTYEHILKLCYSRIQKYNSANAFSLIYSPPLVIFSRPIYNYSELIKYLIVKLINSGLKAYWDNDEKGIYISWHINDIDKELLKDNSESVSPIQSYFEPVDKVIRKPKKHSRAIKEKSNNICLARIKYNGIDDKFPVNKHV